jgi:hypothetical protein
VTGSTRRACGPHRHTRTPVLAILSHAKRFSGLPWVQVPGNTADGGECGLLGRRGEHSIISRMSTGSPGVGYHRGASVLEPQRCGPKSRTICDAKRAGAWPHSRSTSFGRFGVAKPLQNGW